MTRFDDNYGALLIELEKYLIKHCDIFDPEFAAYESPILRPHDKLKTLRKLYILGPFIEYFFLKRGIKCEELDLRKIKNEVTGNPHAAKEQVSEAVARAGIYLPKKPSEGRFDAGDAAAGWIHMQRLKDKMSIAVWDKRLGRGGGLL